MSAPGIVIVEFRSSWDREISNWRFRNDLVLREEVVDVSVGVDGVFRRGKGTPGTSGRSLVGFDPYASINNVVPSW